MHPFWVVQTKKGLYTLNFIAFFRYFRYIKRAVFQDIRKANLHDSTYQELVATQNLSRVAQSVTCLATDASLTADQGVASSILARSHTFVEIDHDSTVIISPLFR